MTNHVHLVLAPSDNAAALSAVMQRLELRHTRRINRRLRNSGTLWEGRYKSSPIPTDAYLLACGRYVELNPVRAGMVGWPEDYPWSSFRAQVGMESTNWLVPDPACLALGRTDGERIKAYRDWVQSGISPEEWQTIHNSLEQQVPLGTPLRKPGRPPDKEK